MDQEYVSDVLYHFVGRNNPLDDEDCFRKLKQILKSGYVAAKDVETGELQLRLGDLQCMINLGGNLRDEDLVTANITCFCDIPLKAQGIHYSKYGKFGIGFRLDYLARVGARPVYYLPFSEEEYSGKVIGTNGGWLIEKLESEIKSLFIRADEDKAKNDLERVEDVLSRHFAAFIKPYDRDLPIEHLKFYYTEREWRNVGSVKIDLQQVKRITVAKEYKQRLIDDMPELAALEIEEVPVG
ncbi:abortive infection system antitoxin AbiGi family protein [Pseudomonas sp. BN411]|uniref:abortive infection system antitoxin AbiGi family protein n=1 Tax=Pseudomonas sp. BN411 TaxID=2567887 RepID=UPI0024584A65|nr:abortive infection system antitoxin AbiGi family protein [Pseudomonas sp. BN411]MDH4562146.1 hypothetical protein [Pseudomonas sp. BN411]